MYISTIYTKFCVTFRSQVYHQGNRVVSHVIIRTT